MTLHIYYTLCLHGHLIEEKARVVANAETVIVKKQHLEFEFSPILS
jgi:hypothetical protein